MNQRTPVLMPVKNLVVPVLTYSRVSGYYNPVSSFNKGKAEEYKERKMIQTDMISSYINS